MTYPSPVPRPIKPKPPKWPYFLVAGVVLAGVLVFSLLAVAVSSVSPCADSTQKPPCAGKGYTWIDASGKTRPRDQVSGGQSLAPHTTPTTPFREPDPVTTLPPATTLAAAPPVTTAPPSPTGPLTEFGDGTYKVGEDIAAGTYKSPGGAFCYWARLRNDSGDFGAIITNHAGSGPARVTVKKGEFLEVSGCQFTKS
ncbi:hypothetical protein ACFWIW_10570 [Amycolatopsis sp. NPDC058340]|uniref:hypothetical protein n=1 Tax=Amycolatopsis sp. NPDC058340 TaxID=3346453 RepID=UPI00364E273E